MTAPAFVRLPVTQHSPEWHAMHLDGISSSQIPILMGNRPGLLELWAAQTGKAPMPEPDPGLAEQFEIGILLEDDLAELYKRREGRKVRSVNQMLESRAVPWARASLDREVPGAERIVELKTALNRNWKDGPESVPAAVQDQVQWQMFVTGWDVADVAVLEGGRFQIYEVGRDDGYIEDELYTARWFRELVAKGEMPPLDRAAHRTLRRLYPYASGEIELLVGEDAVWDDLARRYQEAQAAEKKAKSEFGAVKAAIEALIGTSLGVESEPGGYRIALPNTRRIDWQGVVEYLAPTPGSTEEPRYLELIEEHTKVDWPAIAKALKAPKGRTKTAAIDAHSTRDGARRFDTSFKHALVADDEPGDADEQEDIAA